MIAHEAIGVTQHVAARDGARQDDQKARPILVILEDRPAVITPRGDVIDTARELEPERSGHAPKLPLRLPGT